MLDKVSTITWEHIDHRNLDHCVATWLQAHGSTSHVNQYLTREGGVVDAHIELETLILCLSANTLAYKVYTMAHIAYVVDALHLEYMCLVAGKVRISLDGSGYLVELGALAGIIGRLEYFVHPPLVA